MRLYTILAVIFILALIVTLYVFKRFGKNMNDEDTPYVNNLEVADDFVTFENERELTEEEYLAEWEEKHGEAPTDSDETTDE